MKRDVVKRDAVKRTEVEVSQGDRRPAEERPSRRSFIQGSLAALTVIGFDLDNRSWATEENPATLPAAGFPQLKGELITQPDVLDWAANDFGNIVHRRPMAVLRPDSKWDVVAMVRFAKTYGIPIAARGQGHSTFGQSQVEAGVVIDMSTLSNIGPLGAANTVGESSAWVDAGVRWSDLMRHTLPLGVAPPVLTDYIELSVAGTLSVGGIGAQGYRRGAQVDNVLGLEVVTGDGRRLFCSENERRRLFYTVLGGLGQHAIILRAHLRLVPAPEQTRFYQAIYADLSVLLEDLNRLVDDERFDTVQGFALGADEGGWIYALEATYNLGGTPPDDAALTGDLGFLPGQLETSDIPYFDYLNRVAPTEALLRELGVWFFPHPWFHAFLPEENAEQFISETLGARTAETFGQGLVLIYPYRRSAFTRPALRVPDSEKLILFGVLSNAIPPTPERAAEMIEDNREMDTRALALGGTTYPINPILKDTAAWREHYGPRWDRTVAFKDLYDPAGILTPGQGIFDS